MSALLSPFKSRRRGRRRASAVRDWPVGWRVPVDPWDGAPMFDAVLSRQQHAVFLAGRATVTW